MNKLFKKVYDISILLGEESIDFPGDTPFSREFRLNNALNPKARSNKSRALTISRVLVNR